MKKILAITTYNRLSFLNKSIESLLECTPDFDELVIADDFSSDGTIDYLVELSQENPKIHITVANTNSGVCESVNRILQYCHSKFGNIEDVFLAKMEDDMSYTPGWLDKCLDLFEIYKDQPIGFVGGYVAPEHPTVRMVDHPNGHKLFARTEMRGNCMIGRLDYWYSMYPIPENIPGKSYRRGKPDNGHGSHNDWHFLRDHDLSVEKTGKICILYPGLLKHEGAESSTWGNRTIEND